MKRNKNGYTFSREWKATLRLWFNFIIAYAYGIEHTVDKGEGFEQL